MSNEPKHWRFFVPTQPGVLATRDGRRRLREIARSARDIRLEREGLTVVVPWSRFWTQRVYESDLYEDGKPDTLIGLNLVSECFVVPG